MHRLLKRIGENSGTQRDPEKALAYLVQAKKLQPDNAETLFEFGKTCLELDLYDDALSALKRAVQLRPGSDSYAYVWPPPAFRKKQYERRFPLFRALFEKPCR